MSSNIIKSGCSSHALLDVLVACAQTSGAITCNSHWVMMTGASRMRSETVSATLVLCADSAAITCACQGVVIGMWEGS